MQCHDPNGEELVNSKFLYLGDQEKSPVPLAFEKCATEFLRDGRSQCR